MGDIPICTRFRAMMGPVHFAIIVLFISVGYIYTPNYAFSHEYNTADL